MLYNFPFSGRNRVTSAYGRRTLNGTSSFHRGLDIVGDDDRTVHAVIGGTVESSTIITNHNDLTWQWGNYVKVRGDDGLYWFYCHMDSRAVKVGQRVEQGTVLGIMGNTGYSFGAHTHLEVRNKAGSLDPCELLGLANVAGVTYHREALEAAAIGVLECTEASYRWRTGPGTDRPIYYDAGNNVLKYCRVGTGYRVYAAQTDGAGQVWCQITPPVEKAPALWVSAACGTCMVKVEPKAGEAKPEEPALPETETPEQDEPEEPALPETETPEQNEPEADGPGAPEPGKPYNPNDTADWNSDSNDFVVSASKGDREHLRKACAELALPVKNL